VSDAAQVEGERTRSAIAARRPLFSRKQKGAPILIGAVMVCGWMIWSSGGARKPGHPEIVPPLRIGAPEAIAYPPPAATAAPAVPPTSTPADKASAERVASRPFPVIPPMPPLPPPPIQAQAKTAAQPPKLLVYGGNPAGAPATPAQPVGEKAASPAAVPGGGNPALAAALKPTMLKGTTAALLPHPMMTIAQGTSIPCTLQTALDSALPGFATCQIPFDVKGTEGNVTLLDAGTQVFGEVHAGEGVRPGQDGVFVLWTRARTPHGVVIDLASPATDALGRSGIAGAVDNHWWARFGNALLFTLIDSASQLGTTQLSKQGATSFNLNSASSPATASLQADSTVPPTITVRQGEQVAIMVARDLDFAGIYGLTLTGGH
jgi:type IV secretion system protein VirB10